MKLKNKFILLSTMMIMIIGSILSLTPIAFAADGGGGGNTSNGGNGTWHKIRGKGGTSEAWNQFLNQAGRTYGSSWASNEVVKAGNRNGNPKLREECQSSSFIWYTAMSYSDTSFITQARGTNTWSWRGGHPRNTAPSDWNNYMNWPKNGWDSGSTIVICSGSFQEMERDCSYNETRTQNEKESIEGIYATNTTLNPDTRVEYKDYTAEEKLEWIRTHETQQTAPELSKLGVWYDKNKSEIDKLKTLKGTAYSKKKKELVDGANNSMKGDYVKHPKIDMSKKNKEGFANGGVFTVSEGERPLTIELSTSYQETRHVSCKQTMQPNGKWGPKKEGKKTPWVKDPTSEKQNKPTKQTMGTMKPETFWQLILASCNPTGMNNASNAAGGTKPLVNSGNVNSFQTKKYKSQGALPLNNAKNSNPNLSATAYEKFYNSIEGCRPMIEEKVGCVADPMTFGTKGSHKVKGGSEIDNNIQDNVNNSSGVKIPDAKRYGARGEAINNKGEAEKIARDNFSYFRDNKENNIELDVWYPKFKTQADQDKGKIVAKDSYIQLDPKGTPTGDMVNIEFGKSKLDPTSGKTYRESGMNNNIKTRGSWASDDGKPHKANVSWLYDLDVYGNPIKGGVNADSVNIGFNGEVPRIEVTLGCDMKLNTKGQTKPDYLEAQSKKPVPGEDVLNNKFNEDNNKHVDFGFVRAGSGLNQN